MCMKNDESLAAPASDATPDSNDSAAVWNLPPTTMIGARPTVSLVQPPNQGHLTEAESVASLGFWITWLRKMAS